jgi:hypothetical protein
VGLAKSIVWRLKDILVDLIGVKWELGAILKTINFKKRYGATLD